MRTRLTLGSIIVVVVSVALAISLPDGDDVSEAAPTTQPGDVVDSDDLARFVAVIRYIRSEPTPADVKADNIPLLSNLDTALSDLYITGFITPYTGETPIQVKARLLDVPEEDRFIALMVESYRLSPDPLLLDIVSQFLALYYVESFTAAEDLNASEEFLKRDEIQTLADGFDSSEYAIAPVPSRTSPAEYTRYFVRSAIARYESEGLDATLAHYNSPESVDGQWYVFIIDENDQFIAHPDPGRLGLDLNGWVGTDLNGYQFGPAMLSATEEGKWVSYVYRNPESGGVSSGDFDLKNVWVERRDGLLFASGWYIDADAFTRMLVSVAVEKYREGGLSGTVAYFASPGSALAGLEAAVAYYNATETVDGHWFAFIGDPDGKIVAHSEPPLIGRDIQAIFGDETFQATEDGGWVESESLRVWVASYDGYLFGSGWRRDDHGP